MNREWVKEQLYLKYGDKDFENAKGFNDLPLDLTVHILSYIQLKDIKNVILVCKLFYQCMFKPHFWTKHIERMQLLHNGVNYMQYFSTFKSPVEETIREKTQFLFRKGWLLLLNSESHIFIIRKTYKGTSLRYCLNKDMTLHNYGVCTLNEKWDFVKGSTNVAIAENSDKWFYWNIEKWGEPGIGKRKYEKYGLYEGEIGQKEMGKDYEAHGSGKWTFHDGTILEGEGVAWYGEPRKPFYFP